MMGAGLPNWVATLVDQLQALGIPFGGIVVGLGLGAALFFTVSFLLHRPSTDGAGTVPVRRFSGRTTDASANFPGTAPHPVRISGRFGERTVYMLGTGERPVPPLPRARGFVVGLVAGFLAVSAVLLYFYAFLFARYDHLVGLVGAVLYWPLAWPGVYAVGATALVVPDYIFPMYLAAMAAFAGATGLLTNRPRMPVGRRLLALLVVLAYVGASLVVDALFFTVPGATLHALALIVRTFLGGLFMALLTFCAVFVPHPQRITARFPRDRRSIAVFFALALAALATAGAALLLITFYIHLSGLVGALTLILLLPILTLELFGLLGRMWYFRGLRHRPVPPSALYHPSVSILMPAYNEEEWIAEAIASADRAAARYPGPVQIVVGNDGSTDRTSELARAAVLRLEHARGLVVDLPHGGKSNALNGALAIATGEIVLRCDGDTFISEEPGFSAMISHFADPEVGGVQGAVHPRQRDGWPRKLRALEIAWNHYLLRPAGMGTRSAEVIDGLFSAYRRKDLVELGGWVPWNGEDTEISMRVQRLGYRLRIEFGAIAFEDVPENYNTLRKQRVRWARGILMANGQHYPALLGPTPEFGGLAVFFWFLMLMRSGVRSLVYLFLVLLIVILGVPALVDTAVLLAIAIAIRAIPLGYFLVRMRRTDVLAWIPFFPFANVLKQTFRFEALGLLGPLALREYV
jgi:cellulose synthase/poly-beta-1,6-N-acetylglucosamine synthase-like glycosyltransferase